MRVGCCGIGMPFAVSIVTGESAAAAVGFALLADDPQPASAQAARIETVTGRQRRDKIRETVIKHLRMSRREVVRGARRRTSRPSSEGLFARRSAGDLARPPAGASQLRDSSGIAPASLLGAGRE